MCERHLTSRERIGKMRTEQELVRDYKVIREDYRYNFDIFSPDDERVTKVKYIIDNRLTQVDKTIILLYADCGSLRKLGKRMGMSHMTLQKEVKRIKKIILDEYSRL